MLNSSFAIQCGRQVGDVHWSSSGYPGMPAGDFPPNQRHKTLPAIIKSRFEGIVNGPRRGRENRVFPSLVCALSGCPEQSPILADSAHAEQRLYR
jgi:hypothetical protein